MPSRDRTPTAAELAAVEQANDSARTPVVFVHGLWLLPGSWDHWTEFFESAGYAAVAPGWPGEPVTVDEARARPELLAGTRVRDVVEHHHAVIERLDRAPVLIGHSYGGMVVQALAGRGVADVTVAIDPAPTRGVLPVPRSAFKASWPVVRRPANRKRAVTLTFEQFRYGFANAVAEDEARELYERYHVAAPGMPLFQAAFANINPWTQVRADARAADRGPMLIISGERDHQVPSAIARAAYKRQARNKAALTEVDEIAGRGHSLTIDSGWQQVARTALEFATRFAPPA